MIGFGWQPRCPGCFGVVPHDDERGDIHVGSREGVYICQNPECGAIHYRDALGRLVEEAKT